MLVLEQQRVRWYFGVCLNLKVTLLDTRAMRYKTIITYPCVAQIHCNGDGTRLCVAMILAECVYKTVRCRVGFGRAESTLPFVVHPFNLKQCGTA